ncbi:AmmeMemoRadiSam system protein B [Candidatus Margulisiibacteriota bacterium]
MAIVYGAILPHPPVLVPVVGGDKIKEVSKTKKALEEVGRRLKEKDIDSVVIITPHGNVSQVSIPVYSGHVFSGNLGYFGAPKPSLSFKGDQNLSVEIFREAKRQNVAVAQVGETFMDHGVIVPLYYPYMAGFKKPIVPVALAFLDYKELFSFGEAVRVASENLGKKVAVIASGDLSHRLTLEAPAGYSPDAHKFDDKLVELVKKGDAAGIMKIEPELIEKAGECGLRSIIILMGALSGLKVKPEVLSYEGPFGVGYMVATFDIEG